MSATFICRECEQEYSYSSTEEMTYEERDTEIGRTNVLVCPECGSKLTIEVSLPEIKKETEADYK